MPPISEPRRNHVPAVPDRDCPGGNAAQSIETRVRMVEKEASRCRKHAEQRLVYLLDEAFSGLREQIVDKP